MVTKKNETNEPEVKEGKVKVGKLEVNKETVKDLTDSEQKQVKGGVLPHNDNLDRGGGYTHGGGTCHCA